MKAILIVAAIFFATVGKMYAQHILVSPLGEKTVSGWQYGAALSFSTKSKWSFGGFYQQDMLTKVESGLQPANFYGLTVNAPLAKCDKLNFYFNTRLGLANQYFVVLVPGLETELNLTKRFSVSTLMSVRMSYPSAALKVNIRL